LDGHTHGRTCRSPAQRQCCRSHAPSVGISNLIDDHTRVAFGKSHGTAGERAPRDEPLGIGARLVSGALIDVHRVAIKS
jgi:hypothetical protein